MVARIGATVRFPIGGDDKPGLTELEHVMRPARRRLIQRGNADRSGSDEVAKCPGLAPLEGPARAIRQADSDLGAMIRMHC